MPCDHPAQALHVTFVGRRRYDWRATCRNCNFRWRPEVPDIPAQVEKRVAGVAAHMTWHGFVLDYRPLGSGRDAGPERESNT